jgi:hypothetical protein
MMEMARRKLFTPDECTKFGLDLRNRITERGLTVTGAASLLGVSRQALYFHFAGKHQPRWRVVERAVRLLDLEVYVQSQKFDKAAFGVETYRALKKTPVQLLLLPEALTRLNTSNLEAKVVRAEGDRIYLELLVKFAG